MAIKKAMRAVFEHFEECVAGLLLASFVLLLFVQIIARQFFHYSLPWGEELATYMFVWFAYLGAVVAAKMAAHNRVTFQFGLLPPIARKICLPLSDLAWIAFNLYFAYLSYDFIFNRMSPFWKSQTLGLPMKYFYMILPLAFLVMSVRIAINMYLGFFKGQQLLDPETAEIEKLKRQSMKET